MTINKELSDEIIATEERNVSQKATGQVIIYNNYESVSQRLINNTRLQADDGRIYRLVSSVTIPGRKKVNGTYVPGKAEANVIADEAGEKFNLLVSDLKGDFKIPGFKGSPRYDGFYGRISKDIVGGYSGKQKFVSEKSLLETEESLRTKAKEILVKEMYYSKPDGFVIFDGAYYINDSFDTISGDGNKIKVVLKSNLNALLFDNKKTSAYLVNKSGQTASNTSYIIYSNDKTKVAVDPKISQPWLEKSLNLAFSGQIVLVGEYNKDNIKRELAGKKSSDFVAIIAKNKNVADSEVSFRPVWYRTFSNDLTKIKIKDNLPKID
jgi:hypothetical protein